VIGTPDFSEVHYTITTENEFFAVDDTNFKQAIFSDLWYRAKLETADHNTYYSKSVIFNADVETRRQYHMASEIVRKELLRLRRFTGIEGYLLKRKSFGKIRKDSVDPITGVPITDNTTDYGTGLDGGYFKPLKVLFAFEHNKLSRTLNQAGMGVSDVLDVSLRMIGHPLVETYDVLVDTIGYARYVVKATQSYTFPGTGIAIMQQLEASQVPYTDPIYQIPLK